MPKKLTYEELEQRVQELEKEVPKRKKAEEALERRLKYERMLRKVSERAALLENAKRFQDESLEAIGEALDIDRAYIFEHNYKNDTTDNIFEWCAPDIRQQKDELQGIPSNDIRWWFDLLRKNEVIRYKDIEDIPSEQVKEILRPQNIKSILVVPLYEKDRYFGFIGLDECRHYRDWLDEDVDILKTTSQIIIGVIERKRAEEVLKERGEKIKLFAYSVSHDIKNPVIGIYLLTKYLNENYNDILDEKGKNYCDQIMKASEDLATLVDTINVYISTKEAPLIIERVNLNQVFDTVRDEFSAQLLIRQISWSQPENLLEINVDRLSILRVMRNFVDNALKYGGDELSEINIGCEESDGFHIFSIEDDGIGIAEEDSKQIFIPFERSATSIGIKGTGLGLAIAHVIANQHKGKVWTELGPQKGIIFNMSISKDLKLTK